MTGARELIEAVLDAGTFASWDAPPRDPPQYADELARARKRTGYDESVITGEGLLDGRRVAIAACEFSFLAGSIGVAAAERLAAAVERATAEGMPMLASPASGGTRMQEGALAFTQMIKITAAVSRHRAAGLPYLVYLRDPTTGGVLASWGSLGQVTAAEPGALIGFLGPRVYEALYGVEFPEGVQTAENLFRHGVLDGIVPPEEVREVAIRALAVLMSPRPATHDHGNVQAAPERVEEVDAWEAVMRSRRPDRPGIRSLLRTAATDVTRINAGDSGLMLALARFGGAGAVVLGHDRRGRRVGAPFGPAGLRVARRGMRLASELGLPLVSVIDAAGVQVSRDAEERGLAAEIARCLSELVMLPAPTVSVLLGEGAGGGALALLPADRVVCAQHGWLSPLPPEGSSAILYRSIDWSPEVARDQRIRAVDLRRDGIVDRIVPELPDAAYEPEEFCARVAAAVEQEIGSLVGVPDDDRLQARMDRFRSLGSLGRNLP